MYLLKGGPVLVLIGAASIAAGAFAILQWIRLKNMNQSHSKPLQELARLTQNCDWYEALQVVEKHTHPFLVPWRTAYLLLAEGKSDTQDVEEAVLIEGQHLMARLESALKPLGALTTVLPMLGFLGTILGLISSFRAWEQMGTQVSISVLAGGIYQAMITTAAGLFAAILYYVLYHVLVAKTQRVGLIFSQESTHLFRWIREGLAQNASFDAEKYLKTTP